MPTTALATSPLDPDDPTALERLATADLGTDPAEPDRWARACAGWALTLANPNTRAAYRRDVKAWHAWTAERGVPPWQAQRPHVEAWARSMEADGLAPATRARRLAAVASLYRYAEDAGEVSADPTARVRRPKVSATSTTDALDRDQAAALLDAAERAGPRDLAALCLLVLNGLRVSEVAALDVTDLGTEGGHRFVRVRGKGDRLDRVPLAPRTVAALDAHRAERTTGPLVLDNAGGRLDRHKLARIVARVARAAGLPSTPTPHVMRHTAVTEALRAGVPLHLVQDLARHADPRTTRRYDRAARSLDQHATYALAAHLAPDTPAEPEPAQ